MKILIVEDSPKTATFLSHGLVESGFVVDVVGDGETGIHLGSSGQYDALIIDVMVPGKDGFDVLAELRGRGIGTPALFLTARVETEDRVRGLNLGADDYLVKPFAISELIARLRAILRRGRARQPDRLAIADLTIDPARRRAMRGDRVLDLTAKEFGLLWLLARHAGEVLSRDEIAEQVWDMNFQCETNVVDVHIRRLRAKLDDPFPTKLIRTVRGAGYLLAVNA
jgi:two-component system copper resistance phosphate regulon response regulator CusR